MSIFSLFKKRQQHFLLPEENIQIVEAVRNAEKKTSGEIRIFIESNNSFVNPIDRAAEVFYNLKMQNTTHRNAVLLYIAMIDKQLALFADEGIYKECGDEYWNNSVKAMIALFAKESMVNGIVHCINNIGEALKEKFPFDATEDTNELPDDIVFGK